MGPACLNFGTLQCGFPKTVIVIGARALSECGFGGLCGSGGGVNTHPMNQKKSFAYAYDVILGTHHDSIGIVE